MAWGAIAKGGAAGLTAAGQLQEGKIAAEQGKFIKRIAARNQKALERQAKAEREAARVMAGRAAFKEKVTTARQRTLIGKSGIGLAGATLSLLADTAFQFSMERNLILRGGMIRSRELIARGRIEMAKGNWARTLGKKAEQASHMKAGVTLLGSAGGSAGGGTGGAVGGGGFGTTQTGTYNYYQVSPAQGYTQTTPYGR